jgi:hypothetical protein
MPGFYATELKRDPHWIFLILEDRLFSAHNTVRCENLNAFSYAELFGEVGQSFVPLAWR